MLILPVHLSSNYFFLDKILIDENWVLCKYVYKSLGPIRISGFDCVKFEFKVVLWKMQSLAALKEDVKLLEKRFSSKNDVSSLDCFRLISATLDEIVCEFVPSSRKTFQINANIPVRPYFVFLADRVIIKNRWNLKESYPKVPPMWFFENEDASMSDIVDKLSATKGEDNKVRRLHTWNSLEGVYSNIGSITFSDLIFQFDLKIMIIDPSIIKKNHNASLRGNKIISKVIRSKIVWILKNEISWSYIGRRGLGLRLCS